MREANLECLMRIKLGENEDVSVFRDRCVHLVGLVYDEFERHQQQILARDHFLFGLPDNLKRQVLAGRPKSLEEVVSLAAAMMKTSSETAPIICEVGRTVPDGEPIVASVGERRSSFWKPQRQQLRKIPFLQDRRSIRCFRCKRFGHVQRNCQTQLWGSALQNESIIDQQHGGVGEESGNGLLLREVGPLLQ